MERPRCGARARTPEAELALALCGTAARRAALADRIRELASVADLKALAADLERQKLATLVGSRLLDLAGPELPDDFSTYVRSRCGELRMRCVLVASVTRDLSAGLADAGIETVVLKGPSMGERLFGDPGMRLSHDIDLLVGRDDFWSAAAAIEEHGYQIEPRRRSKGELPIFEWSLRTRRQGWLPPVDLHWRVHWHEAEFSRALIRAAVHEDGVGRVPQPVDELTMLLLMFARDGFQRLRPPADVAAWWDRYGSDVDGVALDATVERFPLLRHQLTAAARLVEQMVGVPAERLITDSPDWRGRNAARLANWSLEGGPREQRAAAVLADGLLTPRGDFRNLVRRHVLPPRHAVARIYGLPERAVIRQLAGRIRFGAVNSLDLTLGAAGVLSRTLGGRALAPLPPAAQPQLAAVASTNGHSPQKPVPAATGVNRVNGSAAPLVSVIIPARDSQRGIAELLNALSRQTCDSSTFEVLVVDDCSADDTRAVAEASGVARVLSTDQPRGSYNARNVALRVARGPLLAFTDSDCKPAPDWIANGLRAFAQPDLDLVAGHIHVPLSERPTTTALVDGTRFLDQKRYAADGFGATANLWVRREVFDAIGWFNPVLISGGDTEFGMRAVAAGFRIEYGGDVVVEHGPRTRPRQLARKSFRLGFGAAQHLAHAEGPLSQRARVCTRPGAYIPKGALIGLERLEQQGYRLTKTKRAEMHVIQYFCVKLPNTLGNLAGSVQEARQRGREEAVIADVT